MSAAGPRSSGISDYSQTAAWGQEEIAKAIEEDELAKSLKKAQEAERVAQEASLKTVAFDGDDPILQDLKQSLEEEEVKGPLPLWLLVVLGFVMLSIGGVIGWFFSRG